MGNVNPYAGMGLDDKVNTAYTGSLGGFSDLASGNALGRTDLSQYINPFIGNVVNSTMGEMNRQQGIEATKLASDAQAQHAFGGDRFAIESAANNRNWNQQKANTAANLFNTGFNSAVDSAKFDIGTQGAALGQLGSLANQGFQWGNDLYKQSSDAANQQQDVSQKFLDAIKGQYQGFTNQGTNPGLNALLAVFQGLGSNMSSSTSHSSGDSSSSQFGISGK